MGALTGMRVVDVSVETAGSYCARLLGDFGADVIRIEDTSLSPHCPDSPADDALYRYVNQNKRGVALALDDERGRELWRSLIMSADVVVDSGDPGVLARYGLTAADIKVENSKAIVVSVTPFGLGGPYAGRPACHLTVSALGGLLKTIGDGSREPLEIGFPLLDYVSGVVAAVGALAVWRSIRAGAMGQQVDVSQQEVAVRMPLYPTVAAGMGLSVGRRTPFPMFVDTLTGYAAVNALSAQHFRDACLYMGLDDVAEDRALAADSALREEVAPHLQKRMDVWAQGKTREEIFHVGQAMRIPTGIPYTLLEVVQEEHYRQRGFFRPLETVDGVVQQPVGPLGPAAVRDDWRDAPTRGQHTGDVLEQWLGGGTLGE